MNVNALTYRTSQAYDPAGRRIRMVDANTHVNTFLFDAVGQDVGSIDPLNRRTTMAYDTAGNQTLKITANADHITMICDGANRLPRQRTNGAHYTFVYYASGNRG